MYFVVYRFSCCFSEKKWQMSDGLSKYTFYVCFSVCRLFSFMQCTVKICCSICDVHMIQCNFAGNLLLRCDSVLVCVISLRRRVFAVTGITKPSDSSGVKKADKSRQCPLCHWGRYLCVSSSQATRFLSLYWNLIRFVIVRVPLCQPCPPLS